eukprot:s1187_g11.t1
MQSVCPIHDKAVISRHSFVAEQVSLTDLEGFSMSVVEVGTLDLRRKAQISRAKPTDHAADVIVRPSKTFDLEKTIFRSLETWSKKIRFAPSYLDSTIARLATKNRMGIEVFWSDEVARKIEADFKALPPAPAHDQALLDFMRLGGIIPRSSCFRQNDCNFAMEHADGSFMDHLQFCYEYSVAHFKEHSPKVLFLHSIMGVGTNYFPMKEFKHIEAFPSILRLLLQFDLLQQFQDMGAAKVGETFDGIKFHRVIDNKSLEDFPRCGVLLGALGSLGMAGRMDDTYMDVFLVVYQLLKDAGKLKAHVDLDLGKVENPTGNSTPLTLVGFLMNRVVPSGLKRRIRQKEITKYSTEIGPGFALKESKDLPKSSTELGSNCTKMPSRVKGGVLREAVGPSDLKTTTPGPEYCPPSSLKRQGAVYMGDFPVRRRDRPSSAPPGRCDSSETGSKGDPSKAAGNQRPGFSFGRSQRETPERTSPDTMYMPPSTLRTRAASCLNGHRPVFENEEVRPDPQTYAKEQLGTSSAAGAFGAARRWRSEAELDRLGPGTYRTDTPAVVKGVVRMSSAKRFVNTDPDDQPGPGAYHPAAPSTRGGGNQTTFSRAPRQDPPKEFSHLGGERRAKVIRSFFRAGTLPAGTLRSRGPRLPPRCGPRKAKGEKQPGPGSFHVAVKQDFWILPPEFRRQLMLQGRSKARDPESQWSAAPGVQRPTRPTANPRPLNPRPKMGSTLPAGRAADRSASPAGLPSGASTLRPQKVAAKGIS